MDFSSDLLFSYLMNLCRQLKSKNITGRDVREIITIGLYLLPIGGLEKWRRGERFRNSDSCYTVSVKLVLS